MQLDEKSLCRISNPSHHVEQFKIYFSIFLLPWTQMLRRSRCVRLYCQLFPHWLIWAMHPFMYAIVESELNTHVCFVLYFLCMKRWLPKTNMFTVSACARILLPWQRGWCWVQLGQRCQVTAELREWRRGAWALGGGERVKGAPRIRGRLQRQRATKTGSMRGKNIWG